MNTKQLRQKILDLAIHGKLVPQDPNDEPASVLLERIRVEKERLIKEEKIKRSKSDSSIIRGDKSHYGKLPFEVPDGWNIVLLGQVSSQITDGEHQTPERINKYQGYYLLSARNIDNGKISLNDVDFVDKEEYERISIRCNPQKGDVLLSCSGSVGRVTVINDDNNYVMVRSVALVKPVIITGKLVMYFLQSEFLQNQIKNKSKQTAQANIFQAAIRSLVLPLPPLAEQHRIAAAIESTFAVIDDIERNKADLQTAVTATKSKILSLAVHGKLVPQDPNDEPASILLERIRKEREKLIKQGKIKRGKAEKAVIRCGDNCYYGKLPPGWVVTKLADIADIIMGQSPEGASVTDKPVGLEFHQGKIYFTERYLAYSGLYTAEYNKKALSNSVLLCVRAPVGAVNITDRTIAIGRGLCAIYPLAGISAEFIFHWLTAFKDFLIEQATGTTFQAISIEIVKSLHIPFPPKNEQTKIVATIENSFNCLEEIINSLD